MTTASESDRSGCPTPGIPRCSTRSHRALMAIRRSLFPASIVPKSDSNPSARAPLTVALSSSRSRRHLGSQPPHFGQLGEHVEVRNARETVGPHGNLNAGLEELADWWNAGTGALVATRTGDERRARRRHSLEVVCVELHPVHDEEALVEESHSIDVVDRTAFRSDPRGIRSAHGFEQLTPGPAARFAETRFRRATRRGARSFVQTGIFARLRRISSNSAGDTEYGA